MWNPVGKLCGGGLIPGTGIGGIGAMVVMLVGVVDEGLELLGPGAVVVGTWLPLHFSVGFKDAGLLLLEK